MENQINVGNQNTQQIGKNPINHSAAVKKNLRINFFTGGIIICSVITLIVFIVYFSQEQLPIPSSSKQVASLPSSQNDLQTELATKKKWTKPIVSPNKDYFVQFRIGQQNENNYSLEIIIGGFAIHSKAVGDNINNDGVLASVNIDRDLAIRYGSYAENYVSWSPKTDQLAIFKPSAIDVYNYKIEPINDPRISPPSTQIKLNKVYSYSVDKLLVSNYDYPLILYSGDSSQLFYINESGIKLIYPSEQVFLPKPGYYAQTVYPIPNSRGISYWLSSKKAPDYKNYQLVLDFGDTFKTYDVSFKREVDIPRQINLSPALDKACVGWESSGSNGTLVVDLNSGKEINGSFGCMQWLSNSQVITQDYSPNKPYYTYFLMDLTSGKKTYLHDFYLTSN